MAALNPSQHLEQPESNIIPSNGHLSSSEPDLHLHLDQSIHITPDDDQGSSTTTTINKVNKSHTTPPNELLNSIRNTANKIARSGTRKLRTLSVKKSPPLAQIKRNRDDPKSASSSSLPSPRSPKHDKESKSHSKDTSKRKLPQNILLHLNKLKRQKSKSNPNSPIEPPEQQHKKANYDSNIIIGATYSHSDNEMVDNKLKSMRLKTSRTKFLNKQRAKRGSINHHHSTLHMHATDKTDIGIRLDEEKEKEYDGDDGYDDGKDEKDEKTSIATTISFQFLKNMKNIDTHTRRINNYIQKQRSKVQHNMKKKDINKSTSFLKGIPQMSLELWKKQQEYELNRFAKMSSQATYKPFNSLEKADYFDTSESISWEKRIMTDIIRAGKLFVTGEVDEIFEFPSFKCTQEKEELVRTTIRYLESAVQEAITSLLTINGVNHKQKDKKLNKDAAKEISVKCVRQSLISLCQEFVNDPYFKHLKQSCEEYNLQPTDIGLVGTQEVANIKSWTPRLCINITGNRIYTHIVRVFQCYELCGIEAMETQIYFGFKRTYSIDCMGGPPWILPPIFLSHDKQKQIAYQISIPKEKVLDPMQLEMPIPDATDFIPTVQ
eukprot:1062747_1